MLSEIRTITWKEWKGLLEQLGGGSRPLLAANVLLFAAAGSFPVYAVGAAWLRSPLALLIYPLLAAALAILPVSDSFAGERERQTLETLLASRLTDSGILFGKLLAAFVPAVSAGFFLFGLGIVTVNAFHTDERWLLPETWLVIGTSLLTITTAGLVACAGVFASLRASSVRQAAQVVGIVVIGAMLAPIVALVLLPDPARERLMLWLGHMTPLQVVLLAGGALLLVDLLFLLASFRRFRRDRIVVV
jgi:ABC-2 type transport system permease protein